LSYLWNQVDGATACPTGMAYAAIPMLRDTPELAAFAERVARHGYDPLDAPVETKHAATIGYAMTEKQGGSDLRANVTAARPAGRGFRTSLESADHTRPDFAVGSAGLIRAALSQALHHADHRRAFGSRLSDLPVHAPVLADLALEWAGAAHLAFRVACAADHD